LFMGQVFGTAVMCASQFSRSALTWSLTLACLAAIGAPAAAAPADVRVVAPEPTVSSASPTGVGSPFELAYWQSVSASNDAEQLEAYLKKYPDGTFSTLARVKIAALSGRAEAPSSDAPTALPPAPLEEAPVPQATADDDLVQTSPPPAAAGAVVTVAAPATLAPAPANDSQPASSPAGASEAVPEKAAPAAAMPASLAQQLRTLSQSQGGRRPEQSPAPPVAQHMVVIPARPQLASVPRVDLPNRFCTARERQDFYSSVYKPARNLADQNDQAATDHMLKLQLIYDDYAERRDQGAITAIAVEIRDYEGLASDVHHASTSFNELFNELMAVPIGQCGALS
jgi:hypothetical protein